jgi:hypothetical protein
MSIKGNSRIIFGMNGERPHADNIGNLQRTLQGVQKEACTYALLLPFLMHSQASQNKKGNWMPWHAFYNARRRVSMPDFPNNDCVKSDHRVVT